jgi:hypothetical protein
VEERAAKQGACKKFLIVYIPKSKNLLLKSIIFFTYRKINLKTISTTGYMYA